jgi:hypothetical protein
MAVLWGGEHNVSTYQYILQKKDNRGYNATATMSNASIGTMEDDWRNVLSSQYHCHGPPNGSLVNTNGIDQPIAY